MEWHITNLDGSITRVAEVIVGHIDTFSQYTGQLMPEKVIGGYAAAQALFSRTDLTVLKHIHVECDSLVQIAREQLGEARFEALAAEGRAMTMEQAVAYALETNYT